MEKSDKTYDVTTVNPLIPNEVNFSDIQDLSCFEHVSVKVKVFNVDDVIEVKGDKRKQDIIIKDSTGSAKFTVWEDNINKIQQGKSYNLADVVVWEYNEMKYLSTSLDNSHSIEEILDIGEVLHNDDPDENLVITEKLSNVRIVAVIYLDLLKKCLKCGSKVIATSDDTDIGKCTKCLMLQCREACDTSISTRIMVKGSESVMPITVHAFGDNVKQIVLNFQALALLSSC